MKIWGAFLPFFAVAAQAQPVVQNVYNASSYQATFSPGSLAQIVGTGFGTAPTVTVGTLAAFVLPQGTATVFNVQLPVGAPVGPTTLTVTAGGQTSAPYNLTISTYSPTLLTANSSGSGVGLFYDAVTGKALNVANPATPGESVTTYAEGLGATSPAYAAGATATAVAKTVAPVTLTVGGESTTVPYAGTSVGVVAYLYQINFTVLKDASGCGTNVVLTIGTPPVSSPAVTLPIATPLPVVCAAENTATGLVRDATHPVAPNSFLTLYAAGLATIPTSTSSIFPGTSYQGIAVTFNGTPVPLYYAANLPPSETVINAMVPAEAAASGTGVITVTNSAGASQNYTVALAPADVGVFRLAANANFPNQAVALLANSYWFTMPAAVASSYGFTACTGLPASSPCGQPAAPGNSIVIYFTGGGLATSGASPTGKPVATGQIAPVNGSVIYQTVQQPTITIGGIPATVGFSGIAPGTASEYQLNTTIPVGVQPGDAVPVVITMGGSSDTVTIAVAAQ